MFQTSITCKTGSGSCMAHWLSICHSHCRDAVSSSRARWTISDTPLDDQASWGTELQAREFCRLY